MKYDNDLSNGNTSEQNEIVVLIAQWRPAMTVANGWRNDAAVTGSAAGGGSR
jgi:hypothetical protein